MKTYKPHWKALNKLQPGHVVFNGTQNGIVLRYVNDLLLILWENGECTSLRKQGPVSCIQVVAKLAAAEVRSLEQSRRENCREANRRAFAHAMSVQLPDIRTRSICLDTPTH